MDWMSEETRAEAIKKLDTLDVQIGMPEVWPQDLHPISLTRPEDGGLYVENHLAYQKADIDYNFSSKDEPVNKALWVMTPQSVNAYYSPDSNSITFLAGILQDPFYSPEASDAENLGRIGMVVAHEITHAFDDNGSQYDENGNIRNWWTDEDREKFLELSGKVVDYYGAMEVQGIPVNGTQTLSENIADLGAVSCITEIAENEGYDLKEMYTAYAGLWAQKIRDEALAANMAVNTHAQPKIRVNAVLSVPMSNCQTLMNSLKPLMSKKATACTSPRKKGRRSGNKKGAVSLLRQMPRERRCFFSAPAFCHTIHCFKHTIML